MIDTRRLRGRQDGQRLQPVARGRQQAQVARHAHPARHAAAAAFCHPATGLGGPVVNQAASIGILAPNTPDFMDMVGQMGAGTFPAERLNPDAMDYASLAPEHIADAIIHAINQPLGVSISEMTVRAAGDHFVL